MAEPEPFANEPPSSRRTTALLLAISVLSLIPRLWLSLTSTLSHNGAWHVFACRNFAREFRGIAHPPLFMLLLKGCDAASHSLLSYRLVPMLAGAGSVFLAGRTLQKLRCLPATCALGSLAAALSTTLIALSNQVEGYSLERDLRRRRAPAIEPGRAEAPEDPPVGIPEQPLRDLGRSGPRDRALLGSHEDAFLERNFVGSRGSRRRVVSLLPLPDVPCARGCGGLLGGIRGTPWTL